jgi:hypothetical protein
VSGVAVSGVAVSGVAVSGVAVSGVAVSGAGAVPASSVVVGDTGTGSGMVVAVPVAVVERLPHAASSAARTISPTAASEVVLGLTGCLGTRRS